MRLLAAVTRRNRRLRTTNANLGDAGRVLLDGRILVLPSCLAMIASAALAANPGLLRLAQQVMTLVKDDRFELAPGTTSVPVGNYCADDRLARERRTLFRRYPIAIAATS